jgi:hypothetical protein
MFLSWSPLFCVLVVSCVQKHNWEGLATARLQLRLGFLTMRMCALSMAKRAPMLLHEKRLEEHNR